MANEMKKIQDYNDIFWEMESPVIIEKMRLAKDLIRGVNVLSITFRNISEELLLGMTISITMKDKKGRSIYESFEYNYYALEVPHLKTFGTDQWIIVEPEARLFQITIRRADFSEAFPFRSSLPLRQLPPAQGTEALGEYEHEFIQRFQKKHPKARILCAPEKNEGYWRCICRRIYPDYITRCPNCRTESADIFKLLQTLENEHEKRRLAEEEALRKEEENARLRAEQELSWQEQEKLWEEEEEQRKLEEERRRQEKEEAERLAARRRRRNLVISAAGFTLAVIGILLMMRYRRPEPMPEPVTVAVEETAAPTEPAAEESATTEAPAEDPVSLAVIGSDLSDEDQRIVLRLIGMKQSDFDKFDVIYISNDLEHQYLDGEFGRALIGSRSLSCMLLTPTEPGSGLNISLYNISYCTEDMYREALLSAGIEDADVVVAGPGRTTGTSALTGCRMLADLDGDMKELLKKYSSRD